ncbi:hypothetical protein CR513_09628, partial [Mucuna pruriens]
MSKEEGPAKEVTNIAKNGGITKSGRIYTPEILRGKETHAPTRRAPTANTQASAPEKEAEEFLKIIRHSEYQLLDQMNKTPARISLLSLLLNSETHQNLLLKVLKEAHVAQDITVERFGSLVNTSRGHLTFSDDEIPVEGKSHNQPLHISVRCGGYRIAQVLIDNGSSLNVFPKATLDKLALVDAQLGASSVVVRPFDGSKREVMGEIALPILIGPALFNINFQVMDIRPAYSCLLRRPWIHAARAVPSSLHQQVKFINNHQIINIMGEKELVITTPMPEEYIERDKEAFEASFQSLEVEGTIGGKPKSTTPTPPGNIALQVMIKEGYQSGNGLGPHLEGIPTPILVQENLGQFGLDYRGNDSGGSTTLSKEEAGWIYATQEELTNWTAEVLPNQDFLEIKNNPISPIDNQTLKNKEPDQLSEPGKGVSTEAEALADIEWWMDKEKPKFEAPTKDLESIDLGEGIEGREVRIGFLAVANYPQWVANIVPVPKKDGKVRMCIDYRDLNRVRPKDSFPLPHIDVLVDNTAQHAFFSFMDGFSDYNQIMMLPEDQEKTMFITLWGTFCYKVMSFRLKNVGATYQGAMVTLFHDMMHKEIEVYVDDMIAKSKTLEQHIEDLLHKYKLRLNPAKCTFGVKTGKLLGFVVNKNGIEVDLDKVKAIREMPVPKSESEVRGFLGRINSIARFIS